MVLNMLSIAGKEQVMLKVRVVEVQRTAIKQLGVNLQAVLNQIGEAQYLLGNAPTYGINGSLLGGLNGGYSLDTTTQPISAGPANCAQTNVLGSRENPANCVGVGRAGSAGLNRAQSVVQAFERVGLVRTLAEPNLTAISGESANFLAGGEFPVPVGQDDNGRITIEFKKFGVGLGFTPVVLAPGRISLRVSTEVSELTNLGAFTLVGGVSIPGLNVRRAETTVELPSGGALMMAGLLQSRSKQNLDKVPGLGSLPVLGSLFRSRDFLSDETELVIIVTPYLVDPVSPGSLQTPADGIQIAHDARTVFLGKLNEVFKPTPGAPGAAVAAYQGPVGPVIE
jgi:pilus assembly protein CpaC